MNLQSLSKLKKLLNLSTTPKKGTTHGVASIPGRNLILEYLVENFKFKTVLDIGCGTGDFFYFLHKNNITFKGHGIDLVNSEDIAIHNFKYHKINFLDFKYEFLFDLIFSSHTIEHNPDTEIFLKHMFSLLKPNGIFCLIWPIPKPEIVGGHVHIFNMGLMLYNIVRLGIDCRHVSMIKCGYNQAIIGKYKTFDLPSLTYNRFEIDLLSKYFPFPAKQGFDGDNPPGVKILNL